MPKSIKNNWSNQLLTLRALTANTGVLHEAQVLQLKYWGAFTLDQYALSGWTIEVDPEGRRVIYKYKPQKKAKPANFAKKIASLDKGVHWLLGEEWQLSLVGNGKLVYRGERLVTPGKTKGNKSIKEQNV